MKISVIVAVSENWVIGKAGALPWHLSADLRRFKRLTTGHYIVMGRKTLESIGRLLPNRTMVVITRNPDYAFEGILVARSLEDALELTAAEDEVFVVGGGEIYRLALPLADRLYLTVIHTELEGDIFFPELDLNGWRLEEDLRHEPDEKNPYPYSFRRYERVLDENR